MTDNEVGGTIGSCLALIVLTIAITSAVTRCTTDKAWKEINVRDGNAEWRSDADGKSVYHPLPRKPITPEQP